MVTVGTVDCKIFVAMIMVGTVDCKIVVAMMMVGTVDWDTDDDDSINTLKPESMYTLLPAWKEYKSIINNVPDQQQQPYLHSSG